MLRFLRGAGKRTKTIWWVLIVVTVVTFIGGFVFLFGAGFNDTSRARLTGAVGTVNGKDIKHSEYQDALNEQRETYRRENGADPGAREIRNVELQAWRSLVLQRLLTDDARKLGLSAHDHEVVLALRTSPPPALMNAPAFQTDGKFDYNKYQQAMTDPNNVAQVAQLEAMTRRQLPMRKLQERLISSVKISERELLENYHWRFDRVSATLVAVPPDSANVPAPTEADLQRAYDRYKNRFVYARRTQVEFLRVPKDFGDEELRAARELAGSLARRARAGENFAGLARDYSEGPNAEKGGEIQRVLTAADLGGDLGPKLAALDTGAVTDAIQDGGSFRVFRLLARTVDPNTGGPGLRLAQIIIDAKPNEERLRAQVEQLGKLREQAQKIGLGKAAAAKALPTGTTDFFDANTSPPELYSTPDAIDWAITAKQGEVSPLFQSNDEYVIVQVTAQRAPGVASREDIAPRLRQLAELEARTEKSKSKADAISQALASGRTLEQAAAAVGVPSARIESMSRLQPDPRLVVAPEVVGALFAARPGQVVGPIRLPIGWYFARVESNTPADPTLLAQVKPQLTNELLQQRQRSFLNNYLGDVRARARVKDLRNEPNL